MVEDCTPASCGVKHHVVNQATALMAFSRCFWRECDLMNDAPVVCCTQNLDGRRQDVGLNQFLPPIVNENFIEEQFNLFCSIISEGQVTERPEHDLLQLKRLLPNPRTR